MRLCKRCEKETDRDADGRCKPCTYALQREYYATHPERRKKTHDRSRKRKTGFTAELFAARILIQGNRCSVCQKSLEGCPGGGNADHCHTTGKPRGVLCPGCNRHVAAIDSPLLVKLLAYASHWRRIHEEGLE
jgi:hypothetical protein